MPPPIRQPDRATRLLSAAERDGTHCVWCRRECTGPIRATTDHLVPKVKGGPSWLENEVVSCGRCNRERGHRSPADWFGECERRGWSPDLDAVVGTLRSLDRAIATRGGRRRARPYLAAQLRRLDRLRTDRNRLAS
ncbi:HNH endonuclease [Pseudonocardia bannensis]|uniref:HNH endonuclease n=1 Tax=Pseudonocardia bannensis TaxID=630973 RepID=A0A848DND1_9PSEU|nr:HNH endonuclease [Pseudonocardia bannensis]NMH94055.1 HNH endonuclease [Pseudonocardia bannensis]